MSSARKLRRAKKAQASKMLPELTGKMGHVLEVGERIAQVSGQISEVNGKLGDLDSLILAINETRNLVTQSLQEGRAVHQEQARQRFATLKMMERLFRPELTFEEVCALEETLRAEFDAGIAVAEETDANPQE